MKELTYEDESSALRNLGRYYQSPERQARMFSFSGAGFEVAFKGTRLEGIFVATEGGRPQGEASLAVLIDEEPFDKSHCLVLSKDVSVQVLAAGLPYGVHRVRVYKRTESACSLTGWRSLSTDGEFVPLAPFKGPRIEIYGDSITAGNGVEGLVGDDNFETRTENALISYGALTAEALKADFSIIAIGGYAVYKSPWNTQAPIKSIPEMFSYADCTWSTTHENAIPWDNQKYQPDLVVINLGTNDDQYLLPLPKPEQEKECQAFKKAMKDFIDLILRAYHHHPKIVVTIGMIKVSLVTALLKEVVKEYPHEVSFLEFQSLAIGGYMANGGHPNRAMHVEAAKELTAFINKNHLLAK